MKFGKKKKIEEVEEVKDPIREEPHNPIESRVVCSSEVKIPLLKEDYGDVVKTQITHFMKNNYANQFHCELFFEKGNSGFLKIIESKIN